MTCIVGYADGTRTIIAADSNGTNGWDTTQRIDTKLGRPGELIAIGFTSSYRFGQIVQHHLELPDPPAAGREDAQVGQRWMVREVIPRLRAALREHGYTKIDNSRETAGTLLLGAMGRLYSVMDDFQVMEPEWGYYAIGCGADYALGHLYGKDLRAGGGPRHHLYSAIYAAAYYSNGVGGRIDHLEVGA